MLFKTIDYLIYFIVDNFSIKFIRNKEFIITKQDN